MGSNDVFISYRRSASWQMAQLMWQELERQGVDAFYDIEDLRTGRIADIIDKQLTTRPYFMPILTYGTLDRCGDPEDWVRREIQRAIETGRQILPIATQGFEAADIDRYLPPDVAAELSAWKRIEISQDNFRQVCSELATVYVVPIDVDVGAGRVGGGSALSHDDRLIVDELRAQHRAAPTIGAAQVAANEVLEEGLRLHDQGLFDDALAVLDHSIELDGSNPIAWMTRAIAHAEKTEPEFRAAVDDHDQAFELDPDAGLLLDFANREIQLKPTQHWGHVIRALALAHLDRLDEAVADLDAAIQIAPGSFTAIFNRGVVRSLAGDADGALADFTTAVALKPTEAWPFGARGEQRAEIGDLAGAIADFTRQIELEPNAENYVSRADAYVHADDDEAALTDLDVAIDLDSSEFWPYLLRGFVRNRLGDLAGGVADYSSAIALDADSAEAYYQRGVARGELGDTDGAISDLRRARDLDPDDERTRVALADLNTN